MLDILDSFFNVFALVMVKSVTIRISSVPGMGQPPLDNFLIINFY